MLYLNLSKKAFIFPFCMCPLFPFSVILFFPWSCSVFELWLLETHREVLGWLCWGWKVVTQSRWEDGLAFLCPQMLPRSWCLTKTPLEIINSLKSPNCNRVHLSQENFYDLEILIYFWLLRVIYFYVLNFLLWEILNIYKEIIIPCIPIYRSPCITFSYFRGIF